MVRPMMVTMNRVSILLLILLAVAACQDPMEPASSVSKLRVLAIQVEPPEAAPGEGVTHRVLYADPEGKGRGITFLWLTCLHLFTPSSDLSSGCRFLGYQMGSDTDGGDIYEMPKLPMDIEAEMTEEEANLGYLPATTVVSICAGGETPDLSSLSEDFSIQSIAELCVGGEGLLAFKTFRISPSDKEDRNTNPTINYITFNGNRLYPTDAETGEIQAPILTEEPNASKCSNNADCPAGVAAKANVFVCETTADCLEGVQINAYLTDDSFEYFDDVSFDPPQENDEAPYISWFADGGALNLDRSRTAEPPGPFGVVWSPPQQGGTFTLYVAVHDLRGGTSWQQYTITGETGASK